jgi:hypothetical protein
MSIFSDGDTKAFIYSSGIVGEGVVRQTWKEREEGRGEGGMGGLWVERLGETMLAWTVHWMAGAMRAGNVGGGEKGVGRVVRRRGCDLRISTRSKSTYALEKTA